MCQYASVLVLSTCNYSQLNNWSFFLALASSLSFPVFVFSFRFQLKRNSSKCLFCQNVVIFLRRKSRGKATFGLRVNWIRKPKHNREGQLSFIPVDEIVARIAAFEKCGLSTPLLSYFYEGKRKRRSFRLWHVHTYSRSAVVSIRES
jgi:hypothetical protein